MNITHYLCFHCHIEKSLENFAYSSRRGRQSWCKDCHREYRKTYKSKSRRFARYGMTVEAFEAILKSQDGKCPICFSILLVPYVDHDHLTNRIRGLLCSNCNRGLGLLGDTSENIKNALKYLEGK